MAPPRPRFATVERITSLEERDKTLSARIEGVDGRVQNIETRVDEIYTLLIQAKGVIWLVTKIFAWIVGSATVLGVAIAAARFFTGR